MNQTISLYWKTFLNFFYKNDCLYCQKNLQLEENYLCSRCLPSLRRLHGPVCERCSGPAHFSETAKLFSSLQGCPACSRDDYFLDKTFCLLEFSNATQKMLHQIKYSGKEWLLSLFKPFLTSLPENIISELSHADFMLPVPLSWLKEWQRGFNQSYLIGRLLQKKIPIPIFRNVLFRKIAAPQASLKRKDRLTKQKGTFTIRNSHLVRGKTVLLVDDVLTTGSTANECARLLKQEGAAKVFLFTLAKTPKYI